jgi:hypothetical protein
LTAGRWHQSFTLPDGRRATADYREPIAVVMQRATAAAEPSDVAAIVAWAEANRHQIEACQAGECDHVVV